MEAKTERKMKEIEIQQREKLTIDKIVMNENPYIMSVEEQMMAKGGRRLLIRAATHLLIQAITLTASVITVSSFLNSARDKEYDGGSDGCADWHRLLDFLETLPAGSQISADSIIVNNNRIYDFELKIGEGY